MRLRDAKNSARAKDVPRQESTGSELHRGEDGIHEDVEDAVGEGVDGGACETLLFECIHHSEILLAENEILQIRGFSR